MSVFKVASRYAKSLIDLSQEQGQLEEVKSNIDQFVSVLKENSSLRAVLANPIITWEKKYAILEQIFKDKFGASVLAFFRIMIFKGRGEILYNTAQEFLREYNVIKGIVEATVISAAPLSAENLDALKKVITEELHAQVLLTNKVDASLIGGFIVKVGDKQIDTSIARKLDDLERYLTAQSV
ncbi:ATP synthase F1, delta subunit [Sphingobacterium spiritivorum ATCC 33300]|uniref:ATP synthase subunit delta n=2 Tax=Sphingobacterium spiritivorum TaxID=258 RepID=A0A380CDC3_SPHSI|nr:ATP synthase F1 subunit delta [Sphingobacterium spiritivorum]EEI94111.1 ATP synthase F1, delta subunit [Sphingobacterium spiritivorum ATCC 33300]QQS94388.1 ATP synthase F1 subunit delta [Sphingobacterium spiritivorum]SUJ18180.1 F-type ATPase subunit delta [Sphingobacterium spiritivorum]